MKRLFSSILFLCALFASVSAQNGKELLRFAETVHDFGQVLISKGAVTCTFEGTNVSSSPVSIMSVTTSCGCTTTKWSHEPIAPGGKASITATYTNDEGAYPFDKTITVKVAGQTKPILLHMRGISQKEIKPDKEIYTHVFGEAVGLEAVELKCGNIEQGGERREQITIANLSSRAVKLSFADVAAGMKVDVKPNPIPAGAHATLFYTISAQPDKWGYNYYCAVPVINGVGSGKTIKVKAFTSDNFSSLSREEKQKGSRPVFEENTYSFGHKKQGARITASFNCTNKGQQTLKVYKADVDFAGAVPSAFPDIAPGKSGRFTVSLDTAGMPKGEALVMVTLTTNSPLRPIVTLFLAGIID